MRMAVRITFLFLAGAALAACGGDHRGANLAVSADPGSGITQASGVDELRPPLGPFSPRIDNVVFGLASDGQGVKADGDILNAKPAAIGSLRIIAQNQTLQGGAEIAGAISPCGDSSQAVCFTVDNIAVAKDKSNLIALTLYQDGAVIHQVVLKIDFGGSTRTGASLPVTP